MNQNDNPHDNENQRLLDELMNQYHDNSNSLPMSTSFHNEYDFMQFQNNHNDQVYPGATPAQQHEKLSYMNKTNNNGDTSFMSQNQFTSHHGSIADAEPAASFLDDMFTTSNIPPSTSLSHHGQSFSQSVQSETTHNIPQQETTNVNTKDLLFQPGDDAMFNYADELGSSLSSSVNSEMLQSDYSSSFSFNPHPLEVNSLTSTFSPNIRSPSSSLRPGSFVTNSLRYGTSVNANNNNGPASSLMAVHTPKTRTTSISSNVDGLMMSNSLSKSTLSHLTAEEKLRRKREFHNAVERRRRELIKQKIKELGNLVPPYLLHYDSTTGKQIKTNKGVILNKSVEYVVFLQTVLKQQDNKRGQLLNKINELEGKMGGLSISTSTEHNSMDNTNNDNPVVEKEGIQVSHSPYISNSENEVHTETPQRGNDDLQEFLSGAVIEAEDNVKLMFGADNSNPADYLLEFEP